MVLRFYKGWLGKHRWRIKAANNEIVAASTQGFASKQMAENNLRLVYDALKKHFEPNN